MLVRTSASKGPLKTPQQTNQHVFTSCSGNVRRSNAAMRTFVVAQSQIGTMSNFAASLLAAPQRAIATGLAEAIYAQPMTAMTGAATGLDVVSTLGFMAGGSAGFLGYSIKRQLDKAKQTSEELEHCEARLEPLEAELAYFTQGTGSFRTQLKAKEVEVAEKAAALAYAQEEISALQFKLWTADQEVSALKSRIAAQDSGTAGGLTEEQVAAAQFAKVKLPGYVPAGFDFATSVATSEQKRQELQRYANSLAQALKDSKARAVNLDIELAAAVRKSNRLEQELSDATNQVDLMADRMIAFSDESVQLRSEMAELQMEKERLRAELQELEDMPTRVWAAELDCNSAKSMVGILESRMESMTEQLEAYPEQVAAVEAEARELAAGLAEAEQRKTDAQRLVSIQSKELQDRKRRLANLDAELAASLRKGKRLGEELAAANSQMEVLPQQMRAVTEESDRLRETVAALQEERDRMQAAIEEFEALDLPTKIWSTELDCNSAKSMVGILETRIESLNEEMVPLKEELVAAHQASGELATKLADSEKRMLEAQRWGSSVAVQLREKKARVVNLDAELAAARRKGKRLGQELAAANSQVELFHVVSAEAVKLRETTETLLKEKEQLEAIVAENEALDLPSKLWTVEHDMAATKSMVAILETRMETLNEQLEQYTGQLTAALSENSELAASLATAEKQKSELQRHASRLSKDLQDKRKRIANLDADLASAVRRGNRLQTELADATSQVEVLHVVSEESVKLRETVARLLQEKEELQAAMEATEALDLPTKLWAADLDVAAARNMVVILQTRMETMLEQLELYPDQLAAAQAESAELAANLAAAEQHRAEVQRRAAALAKELQQKKKRVANLDAELSSALRNGKRLGKELVEATSQIGVFSEQVMALSSESEELRGSVVSLVEERNSLRAAMEEIEALDLPTKLWAADHDVEAATHMVSILETRMTNLVEQLEAYPEQLAAAHAENSELAANLATAQQQRNEVQKWASTLASELKEKKARVANLDAELGASIRKGKYLVEELKEATSKLADAAASKNDMEIKLASSLEQFSALQRAHSALEVKANDMDKQHNQLVSQMEQLEIQAQQYKSEAETLRNRLKEMERSQVQAAANDLQDTQRYKAEVQTLQRKLQEAQRNSSETNALKAKLKEAELEVRRLAQELNQAGQYKAEVHGLKVKLQEAGKYKTEVQALGQNLREAEKYKEEVQALKRKLMEAEEYKIEAQVLGQDLKAAEKYKQEALELKARLKEAEQYKLEVLSLEHELREAQGQAKHLHAELALAQVDQQRVASMEKELKAALDRVQTLSQQAYMAVAAAGLVTDSSEFDDLIPKDMPSQGAKVPRPSVDTATPPAVKPKRASRAKSAVAASAAATAPVATVGAESDSAPVVAKRKRTVKPKAVEVVAPTEQGTGTAWSPIDILPESRAADAAGNGVARAAPKRRTRVAAKSAAGNDVVAAVEAVKRRVAKKKLESAETGSDGVEVEVKAAKPQSARRLSSAEREKSAQEMAAGVVAAAETTARLAMTLRAMLPFRLPG